MHDPIHDPMHDPVHDPMHWPAAERAGTSTEPAGTAPLRWGVLGVADIAVTKVIPAMLASPSNSVVAIASRSADRALAVTSRFGIERAYGSYEALLGCPDIDAVYIPVPNHLHAEWTMAAADAGKHVLCEKPLALSSRHAQAMVDHCERAGVALMEAFMYRLHPLWTTTAALVAEGRIGDVRAIQSVFCYFNTDPTDIRNDRDMGGGALFDIGCYAVNVARMLFGGEPSRVQAAVHRDARFGTDVLTSALLDFDGRHASFVASTQLEPSQRVEIMGTRGRIVIEIPFNIPADRPTRLHVVAGGEPPVSPHVDVIELPATDPYVAQADAFARAVQRGDPMPTPATDAVRNLEVLEEIIAVADRA